MAEENGVEFSATEKDEGKKEVQVDEGDDHASDGGDDMFSCCSIVLNRIVLLHFLPAVDFFPFKSTF